MIQTINCNTNRESSATAYLTSKESAVMPTQFERLAAEVKHSIKMGRVTGLSFPDKAEDAKKRTKEIDKKRGRRYTDKQKIDIGNFTADYSRIREHLGWTPKVDLETGIRSTIEFYREHGDHYWE